MIWIGTHLELVAVTLLTGLAILILLQQRRTPQSTVSWLLFFAIWPWLAIPLFLVLGSRKSRRKTIGRPATPPAGTSPDSAGAFAALGAPPARTGNRIKLIADPEDAAAEVNELIDGARDTLDVCTYLVQPDAVGRAVVDRLTARVRDGVQARLMIDRIGGWRKPSAALRAFTAAGGELRMFPPLQSGLPLSHLNLRNHRKVMIADGARALTGGRNIGANYLGAAADPATWRDLTVAVEGQVVGDYADMFADDWDAGDRARPERLAIVGAAIVQMVPSGPDSADDILHDGLVQAIHSARTRIWIVSPYFIPTEALNTALSIAARRGLDVRIIVPARSNHKMADIARGPWLRSLAEAGCSVVCADGGMIHAKAGVIDDMAWVGSANFDVRSMLLNFEAALVLHDRTSAAPVIDWIMAQAAQARPYRPSHHPVRSAAEGVFALLAPVL